MKAIQSLKILLLIVFVACKNDASINQSSMNFWLTKSDKTVLFQKQEVEFKWNKTINNDFLTIKIDSSTKYQTMNGFGYTLTGGSAFLLNTLNAESRTKLLTELFSTSENNIGVNYLRVSIGASDLDFKPFTYNDLNEGETDYNLEKFSIEKDKEHLIPVLKEILEINPTIKILGSPWSPPIWMKDNNSFIGGSLKTECQEVYANYFVKYLQTMQKEGIVIDAVTVQNEPLHPGNDPSLLMLANQQADFIKNNLGPAFKKANLNTKIILYDHNCDKPEYPISILNDPEAKQYVDGSGFHLYGGDISAMTTVHDLHPDKNLYFTEQYTSNSSDFSEDLLWHIKQLHIGAPRNWSKNVLEWNLANDATESIHTDGGCTVCLGALTVQDGEITRNSPYYSVAHSSKFVRDGSVRIASTNLEKLPNVAYKTPAGKLVLLVLNESNTTTDFNIEFEGKTIQLSISEKSVGTFIW